MGPVDVIPWFELVLCVSFRALILLVGQQEGIFIPLFLSDLELCNCTRVCNSLSVIFIQ